MPDISLMTDLNADSDGKSIKYYILTFCWNNPL